MSHFRLFLQLLQRTRLRHSRSLSPTPSLPFLPFNIEGIYHFLDRLHSTPLPLDNDILMAIIDVTSCAPPFETLKAHATFPQSIPCASTPQIWFPRQLLYPHSHNTLSSSDGLFLQTNGWAEGSRLSPSFANFFFSLLSQHFLYTLRIPILCFVEDIFLLWLHGIDSLNYFTFLSWCIFFCSLHFQQLTLSFILTSFLLGLCIRRS
jgi:hypothetical protein